MYPLPFVVLLMDCPASLDLAAYFNSAAGTLIGVVFDGDRGVGRIYLVHATDLTETWFWGISFQVTKRKSYGYASTLEEAKEAFRAEYETWKGTEQSGTG